uniref:tRNA-synt_2 domain-containing protein n=1 Tax=Syphacia muris TaxID=451379 RepID=A0A0N5ABV2_9BILA
MKSNGIQYIEALRRLFQKGCAQFLRTIHISFVPGEETGGSDGMERFVETDEFKALNAGFALDEGLASFNETYKIYNAERSPWLLNCFMAFAEHQKRLLRSNPGLTIGDIVTVNLTKVEVSFTGDVTEVFIITSIFVLQCVLNRKFDYVIYYSRLLYSFHFQKGCKVIGFSPIICTPPLLHANDEYIEESVFLNGVEIYENLIQALANAPAD